MAAEINNIPYKIYLSEDEMPKAWYNVRADMKVKPAPDVYKRQPIQACSISTLSADTSGAAASKKWRSLCSPSSPCSFSASASEVRGPEAMMTSPSGISVTSPGITAVSYTHLG